ncbi:MAG: sigma-70 family RNA polymerase sigma factor [Azonexus sp.]|nr:sigma-70 family RNA polymerase sigma factor [Azonexus sp.]MCK6413746.1 sigma-70 family RNA polymerase sigma factor [Azonexus sp.]
MPAATIDNRFVSSVRQDMLAFARLQLRDSELAEDAVQEASTAALHGEQRFSGQAALKTWVFGILKHKIVDLLRQQGRSTPISAYVEEGESLDGKFDSLFKENAHWHPAAAPRDWGNPEAALREKHFWAVFDACLSVLPANTARVFMMREFLEFETAEICSSLGISNSNCHVILHRARAALRGCLEQGWLLAGEKNR